MSEAFFTKPLSRLTTKWRIFHEESVDLNPRSERTDFEELRGHGDIRIYRHGQETLAVSTDVERWRTILGRIPGLRSKSGSVFLFADDLLDTVAECIHARRKRQYTPEQLAEAQARAKMMLQREKSLIKSD